MMHAPHGPDPLGVLVVVAGAAGTLLAFLLAARMSLHPGEDDPAHIKRRVLEGDR